jgi:hypothetical protein
VENPLARRIIAGEVRDGDTVHLDAAGDAGDAGNGAGSGGLIMRREARPDAARSRPSPEGDEAPPGPPRRRSRP